MTFVEQRMNIKFCRVLRRTYEMLKDMYSSDTISRTQVFAWHQSFREGRESVEDESAARPQTSALLVTLKRFCRRRTCFKQRQGENKQLYSHILFTPLISDCRSD
ncbi:hypothetical protein TNCV_2954601 [Trichonephila clavipes]|nr:hypothetical protein TNCV_2954601 [Trichonephila clavipes]